MIRLSTIGENLYKITFDNPSRNGEDNILRQAQGDRLRHPSTTDQNDMEGTAIYEYEFRAGTIWGIIYHSFAWWFIKAIKCSMMEQMCLLKRFGTQVSNQLHNYLVSRRIP